MNIYRILSTCTVISNLGIAIFIFLKGRDKTHNIVFGFVALTLSLWALGCAIFSGISRENYKIAMFWYQIGYTGAVFIPICYAHFIFRLLGLQKRLLIQILYGLGCFFLFWNWFGNSKFFLGQLRYIADSFYYSDWLGSKTAFWIVFYISFYWVLVSYLFYLLTKHFRISSGEFREKLKYLLIGSTVGWVGGELQFLPNFGIDNYVALMTGILLTAIYPFIITYGIIRHQLMDIHVVLQKGLVYSVLVAIITGIYSILVLGVGTLFQGVTGYQSFWLNTAVVFIIALLFNPIRDWIQHVLDRRFFNGTLESLEQESQRLQQELFHKEKLAYVGQLASSVAHEIRNPLTTIETFVDCLPQKYGEQGFKEKFNRLVPQEIGRIKKIVNNLLGLAKQRPLVLKPVDIIQSINSTLDLLESHFQLKRITINKEFENNEIIINGDEDALRQVFLNLFLNAIQAMPEAGTLDIRVSSLDSRRKSSGSSLDSRDLKTNGGLRNTRHEPRVTVAISDTGCGIPAHQLKNLFTPFQTTKEEGIGLGLSITKEIVEQHGGTIGVQSEIGKGTTFVLEFSR